MQPSRQNAEIGASRGNNRAAGAYGFAAGARDFRRRRARRKAQVFSLYFNISYHLGFSRSVIFLYEAAPAGECSAACCLGFA